MRQKRSKKGGKSLRPKKPKSDEDFSLQQIRLWLNQARQGRKDWRILLQDLQTFIASLLEEKEQELRVEYFDKAMAWLLESKTLSLTKAQEIELQLRAGQSYKTYGAWEKALSTYQRAVELCDAKAFQRPKADALRWIGNIYLVQNRWRDAHQAYQESLKLCQLEGDVVGEADVQNALGTLHFEQGNFDQASSYYDKAMELAEKANDLDLVATIYNNRGTLATVQGQWEKALACYEESLPCFEKIGNTRALVNTYNNMGMTHADNGNWSKAGHYYDRSYQLAREIGDAHLQATVKLNRVELYLAIKDLPLAEAMCQQALQTYIGLKDHLGEADALKMLGVIHTRRKEWPRAKSCFAKSIQLSNEYHSPLSQAEAHYEYGYMLSRKGSKKEAGKQLRKAIDLFKTLKAEKEIEKAEKELRKIS
ncbi:tetratricopeptide repeat protein [candidate division KSB1 bacterium]|nr:tetratricopeptide repeat protein [candidate division KSB1 bacterium]